MQPLAQQRILIGITGGIAAYKIPEVIRRLKALGADVRVIMTRSAEQFITPLTCQAVCGHRVHTDLFDEGANTGMGHIELARWADLILIAPATADTIAKLAHGYANDLLTTVALATQAPISVAPAMNQQMWNSPITLSNVAKIRDYGFKILGPGVGEQACGEVGPGRMLEPDELVANIVDNSPKKRLMSSKVVITAGPTIEDIDPVRYLSNRSSGKMGFALAEAAARAGAEVTLISGPVTLPTPPGVTRIDVRSAEQMRAQVHTHAPHSDIFIGVAAVADYRVETPATQKIAKTGETLTLSFTRNPDIISEVAAYEDKPFIVGFCAQTHELERYAREKRLAKGCDIMIGNSVAQHDSAFDSDDNEVLLVTEHEQRVLTRASKAAIATQLIEAIATQKAQAVTA